MSVSFSNIQPQQTRKGLAITSPVLGIISIPTFGLLGVGAIAAIVLCAIALNRIRKEPAVYGGKGMAIRLVESKTPGVVKRGEGATLESSFYSR